MEKCVSEVGTSCRILKAKKCKGCNFHRTEEEVLKSNQQSYERLMSLPLVAKLSIVDKYKIGWLLE